MKKILRHKRLICSMIVALILALVLMPVCAFAAGSDGAVEPASGESAPAQDGSLGQKAIAAGIAVGIAAAGGAVGMGLATAKSAEGISRQPESEGKIRTTMMLGLVFIETAIIYALLVVILIIFVL